MKITIIRELNDVFLEDIKTVFEDTLLGDGWCRSVSDGRPDAPTYKVEVDLELVSEKTKPWYLLRDSDFERAISSIIDGSVRVRSDIHEAILLDVTDGEVTEIDAAAADVIVQVACFREVRFS